MIELKKNKVLALLLTLFISAFSFTIPTYAVSEENTADDYLDIFNEAFALVNEQTDTIPLYQDTFFEYDLIIDGETVNVSGGNVRVTPMPLSIISIGSTDYYNLVSGTMYMYYITFAPLNLGTGSVTFNVYYTIGNLVPGSNGMYYFSVPSAYFSQLSAPSSYSTAVPFVNITHTSNTSTNFIAYVDATLTFTELFLPNLEYNLSMELTTFNGAQIMIEHIFEKV
jgi:hypothetical protein